MTYNQFIDQLKKISACGIKPGLSRMKEVLLCLGNPQERLNIIHVAGTNGKGSVCTMISSVLSTQGYKTGLFTSPAVLDFRERIQINNKMISQSEVIYSWEIISKYIEKMNIKGNPLTEFEIITCMAFDIFFRSQCEIVVLETGLGGRLDATNIIKTPLLSVITSVSLDHTNILGNSIEEIAYEKAGIIKDRTPVIVCPKQNKKALEIICDLANKKSSKVISPDINNVKDLVYNIDGTCFKYENKDINISLIGKHQVQNALTAIEAIKVISEKFYVSNSNLISGLKNAFIPARMQVISKSPFILIDGAHNISGASFLAESILQYFPEKYIIGIVGILDDKDINGVFSHVLPLLSEVILVKPNNNRSSTLKSMMLIAKKFNKNVIAMNDLSSAIIKATSIQQENASLIIFGSLYLAGEAINFFNCSSFLKNIKEPLHIY